MESPFWHVDVSLDKKKKMNTSNATSNTIDTTSLFLTWYSVSYAIAVWVLFVCMGLILILISCILRNKHPVKSRGCTHIILLFLTILIASWPFVYIFLPSFAGCIVGYFTALPIATIAGLLFLTRTSRFVLILSISKLQHGLFGKNVNFIELANGNSKALQYFESSQQVLHNKRQLSTLRWLQCCSSTLCTALTLVVGFVIWMAIGTVVATFSLVFDPTRCGQWSAIYIGGFAVITSILWFSILCFDVCINRKLLSRCKCSSFFFEQDLYLYRLEYVISILLLTVFFVCYLMINIIPPVKQFVQLDFPFISTAMYLLYTLIGYFIFGGFIILVTLFSHVCTTYCYNKQRDEELLQKLVHSRMSGNSQEEIIGAVMEEPAISKMFLRF